MRALARTLAERSVVVLDDRAGILPLREAPRLAVVGPCADDVLSQMGCYAFANHVGVQHPDVPLGIDMPTVLDAVRAEFAGAEVTHAVGCPVQEVDRSGIEAAVAATRQAEVCVAVLGDRAGLFGRGTSGEGCDADDLRLPGVQAELLEALLDSGIPVVLVLLTGRPYALGAYVDRLAAVVQAFFPGEEGAAAVAGVLSGRVNPSGRLPVQVPSGPGGQPSTYLAPVLGRKSGISSADPTPCFPFGHGRSYTTFAYDDLAVEADEVPPTARSCCPARCATPASGPARRSSSSTCTTPSRAWCVRCGSSSASPGWTSMPVRRRGSRSGCTPTGCRSRAATCGAWSSRASCSCSWGRRARTCGSRRGCG
jgi:beta-xylosidase